MRFAPAWHKLATAPEMGIGDRSELGPIEVCPHRGGGVRIVAEMSDHSIEDPMVIEKMGKASD